MTEMPYDERRLQLVREADGDNVELMQSDAAHYCPPLDAPMSVHARYQHLTSTVGNPPVVQVWDNALQTFRRATLAEEAAANGVFEDDRERKDFGAALAVWACVLGGGILLAYILHWAWTALTGGV